MNKFLAKLSIAFLSAVYVTACFSGCGAKTENSSSSGSTSQAQNFTENQVSTTYEISAASEANGNSGKLSVQEVSFEARSSVKFIGNSDYGSLHYNNKYGIISTDGKVTVEPIYKLMGSISEDYAVAQKSDGSFVIVKADDGTEKAITVSGTALTKNNAEILNFDISNGLTLIGARGDLKDNGIDTICVDKDGNEVFTTSFDIDTAFDNGIALGNYTNGDTHMLVAINETGDKLWEISQVLICV